MKKILYYFDLEQFEFSLFISNKERFSSLVFFYVTLVRIIFFCWCGYLHYLNKFIWVEMV